MGVPMLSAILISLTIVLLLAATTVWRVCNSLSAMRNQLRAQLQNIEVLQHKRERLIPRLVEIMSEFSERESALHQKLAGAMAGVASLEELSTPARTQPVKNLVLSAYAYPALTASPLFQQAQRELAAAEDDIAESCHRYNWLVARFNTAIGSIPTRFIARRAGYHPVAPWEHRAEKTTAASMFSKEVSS